MCWKTQKSFLELVKHKLDIVFANEQEILSLISSTSFDDILAFGNQLQKHIVITRGDKGAIAVIDGKVTECKSKKNLNIVDLTGAGDLFAAGYLHGLINNLNVEECLAKGTELSSVIIQKIGARI